MNVLFITHSRLGDAILSTCLLNHIIQTHPNAKITVAAGEMTTTLFEVIPQVVEVIPFNKQKLEAHWFKLWFKSVWHRWDIVVDCRGSALAFFLFSQYRFCVYPKFTKSIHRVDRYTHLMKLKKPPAPHLWINQSSLQRANELTKDHDSIIAIAPMANWAAKTWRSDHFLKLINQLTHVDGEFPNASIMVICAPHERQTIANFLTQIPTHQLIDLAGTETLLTIAACLTHCKLFVGNDSGLMHMAAAIGIPTLGLFGPTDPKRYAPYGPHSHYISITENPEELMGPGFNHATSDTLMDSLSVDRVLTEIKLLTSTTHC